MEKAIHGPVNQNVCSCIGGFVPAGRLHVQRSIQPGEPLHGAVTTVFAGSEDIDPDTVSLSPEPLRQLALAGTDAGTGTLHGDGFTAAHRPRTIMVMVPQKQFRDVAGSSVWRTHWLIVGGPLCESWSRDVSPWPPSIALHRTPAAVAAALRDACLCCLDGKRGWQWKWLADVSRVLEYCRGAIADRGDHHVSVTHRVHRLMRRHIEAPLSLEQLADELDVSPSTLSHTFKDETGEPPQRVYRQIRVARSCELLASGATVTDASAATGFASPYHFSRVFSQVMGVPPSVYARDHLSGPLRTRRRRR